MENLPRGKEQTSRHEGCQAPITAAVVIAAGIAQGLTAIGIQQGLHKVAEVPFGCVVGLVGQLAHVQGLARSAARRAPATLIRSTLVPQAAMPVCHKGMFMEVRTSRRNRIIIAIVFVGTLTFTCCAHLGPQTVPADPFDYSAAIADSWKQQTLLNIVKLRYMDLPVFVDVSSIVAGYSIQTGVSINGTVSSEKAVQGNFGSVGGQAIYTDRPTITYVPMTGDKFMRGLITPIDPKNIFSLLQSGYAADFILGMSVESLNGVRNRSAAGGMVREADPDFLRALALLRDVQGAGAVGLRVEEDKGGGSTGVVFFRRSDVPPDIAEKFAEIRRLLKMPPDQEKFVLTFSPARGADGELAVNSRSMLQIMQAFASHIDVPEAHLRDHSAWPSVENNSASESHQHTVRIYSGKDKPAVAFAAVHYRDYWFWVDDGDVETKRALTVIVFIFTLSETGGTDKLPLVTIPAQ
ncbi:MAG TPA: hypothetical protein VM008_08505 [Phycisphaerae bacterium]|nr:hypothetical protein [Phycisphaerae bacterium]